MSRCSAQLSACCHTHAIVTVDVNTHIDLLSSCSEGPVHHTVAEVTSFVEERILGEDGRDSRSLRGPYLARLELMHRLRERGCPEEKLLGNDTGSSLSAPLAPPLPWCFSLCVCGFKQVTL